MLIEYFQNIVDSINNQFLTISDKSKPIINFGDLDKQKQNNDRCIANLSQKKGILIHLDL